MAATTTLQMDDGFDLGVYRADSDPAARAAATVIVIQEIFGVNSHIRAVADGYAMAGYRALAPQIFDRIEPGIELGYEPEDMTRGIDLAFSQLDQARTLADLAEVIRVAGADGPVGVVGFCFGGLLTWLCARDLPGVAAGSAYYGGGVPGQGSRAARCPVMMHFGDADAHIPVADVEKFRQQRPEVAIHRYAADHGFNCDKRGTFNAEAAKLAHARTLEFFGTNLS